MDLPKGPAIVFSGLGNNAHFRATVERMGIEVAAFEAFPDHHAYSPADMEKILAGMGRVPEIKGKLAPAFVLTSEKDHFRLKGLPWMEAHSRQPLYYLEAGLEFMEGWDQLEQKIKEITRHRAYGSTE
ncbi:MAG: tetraacyldisaccharide 4'-kinase [Bacteroidia bacterium]